VAEPEHLAKQVGQPPLMQADAPRDRRVIRNQIAGDHPIGNVLATGRSIARDDRTFVANAYKISATIAEGSYAARP
jgi:hypothetical protein